MLSYALSKLLKHASEVNHHTHLCLSAAALLWTSHAWSRRQSRGFLRQLRKLDHWEYSHSPSHSFSQSKKLLEWVIHTTGFQLASIYELFTTGEKIHGQKIVSDPTNPCRRFRSICTELVTTALSHVLSTLSTKAYNVSDLVSPLCLPGVQPNPIKMWHNALECIFHLCISSVPFPPSNSKFPSWTSVQTMPFLLQCSSTIRWPETP